ncbi:MAG: hypothetical protein GC150_07560 [Rhizobiales bacterium]|nr:hypothetical protein [Hyphomicrobiales bacterium]
MTNPRERWRATFDERIVIAHFIGKMPNGNWRLRLEKPIRGSNVAYVPRRNVQPERVVPQLEEKLFVFLVSQSQQGSRTQPHDGGNWYAELWSSSDNPWLNSATPREGDIVTGTVVRLAGSDGAIVELDEPARPFAVDAYLHRQDVPGGEGGIQRAVDIGDRVAGIVTEVDESELAIRIDCRSAIARLREEAHQKNMADARAERERKHQTQPRTGRTQSEASSVGPTFARRLEGRRIIVFDDDEHLRDVVCSWGRRYGAWCEGTCSLDVLETFLVEGSQAFVLVDYNGVPCQEAIAAASMAGAKVVLWSGHPGAKQVAERFGVRFEQKPTSLDRLTRLVRGEELPPQTSADSEGSPERSLWTGKRAAGKVTEEASVVLEKLCRRHRLIGAVWIRRDRELRYSIQARAGQITPAYQSIETDLWRSIVTSALPSLEDAMGGRYGRDIDGQDRPAHETGALPDRDAAIGLLKGEAATNAHYLALPIVEPDAKARLVVFFRRGSFPADDVRRLTDEHDHLRHMLQLFRVTEHVDSTEIFAATGRLHAAALHEVGNTLQEIVFAPDEIIEQIEAGNGEAAIGIANTLKVQLESLDRLTKTDLRQVGKYRAERLNVNETVDGVVSRMRTYARLAKENLPATLTFIRAPDLDGLEVSLSPVILEQPLANLILNALHHLGGHRAGRIEVETRLTDEAITPIHIIVRDNGKGISADDVTTLFEPRETTRGESGTGMGLYASRNIVQSAGGVLECTEHLLGLGATFRIRLPIRLGVAEQAEEKKT